MKVLWFKKTKPQKLPEFHWIVFFKWLVPIHTYEESIEKLFAGMKARQKIALPSLFVSFPIQKKTHRCRHVARERFHFNLIRWEKQSPKERPSQEIRRSSRTTHDKSWVCFRTEMWSSCHEILIPKTGISSIFFFIFFPTRFLSFLYGLRTCFLSFDLSPPSTDFLVFLKICSSINIHLFSCSNHLFWLQIFSSEIMKTFICTFCCFSCE